MRVLQLIDTLRAAGAERVALNYANALVPHVEKSYLCCTRMEGVLNESLDQEVGYLFLGKKKTLDFKAFKKLNVFIKAHKIDIIHAHATSYFIAWVIKIRNPNIKLIWHLHHGAYIESLSWKLIFYKLISRYCNAILTVNEPLKQWAKNRLKCKNVYYIKNFVAPFSVGYNNNLEALQGISEKRIVCVANLRPEKNHGLLLDAFVQVLKEEPEASLHLYGMAYDDIYSKSIQAIASEMNQVYYHGLHASISSILGHFDIGVLSSDSEGLPLALLEYAQAGLPVVVTNVGQCSEIVRDHGQSVPPGNRKALAASLLYYLKNQTTARQDGLHLKKYVEAQYSISQILPQVLQIYETCL